MKFERKLLEVDYFLTSALIRGVSGAESFLLWLCSAFVRVAFATFENNLTNKSKTSQEQGRTHENKNTTQFRKIIVFTFTK